MMYLLKKWTIISALTLATAGLALPGYGIAQGQPLYCQPQGTDSNGRPFTDADFQYAQYRPILNEGGGSIICQYSSGNEQETIIVDAKPLRDASGNQWGSLNNPNLCYPIKNSTSKMRQSKSNTSFPGEFASQCPAVRSLPGTK